MKGILDFFGISASREVRVDTDFSKFFREAPSSERKKVFLKVAKKATIDQQKVMNM